jgi:hypothetical protein
MEWMARVRKWVCVAPLVLFLEILLTLPDTRVWKQAKSSRYAR